MGEHIKDDLPPHDGSHQPLLRPKPDRRKADLGGHRRSSDVQSRGLTSSLRSAALLSCAACGLLVLSRGPR
jgi:hypothetical protein